MSEREARVQSVDVAQLAVDVKSRAGVISAQAGSLFRIASDLATSLATSSDAGQLAQLLRAMRDTTIAMLDDISGLDYHVSKFVPFPTASPDGRQEVASAPVAADVQQISGPLAQTTAELVDGLARQIVASVEEGASKDTVASQARALASSTRHLLDDLARSIGTQPTAATVVGQEKAGDAVAVPAATDAEHTTVCITEVDLVWSDDWLSSHTAKDLIDSINAKHASGGPVATDTSDAGSDPASAGAR